MKGIRAVTVGRDFYYMGKTLGNVEVPRIEIKGDPRLWVDAALRKQAKKDVGTRLGEYARLEEARFGKVEAGVKQGNKVFWRNALGYFNGLGKSKNATA